MKTWNNVPVLVHADDYGETYNTCMEMIEILKGGYLDGISLITNMRDYDRYVDLFMRSIPDMHHLPLINVHINLVEGRHIPDAAAGEKDDPVLSWNWSGLFLTSYRLPTSDRSGARMHRGEVYEKLVYEISSQLRRGVRFIQEAQAKAMEAGIPYTEQGVRIDAHQHAHMIPLVWKAIREVIEHMDIRVDYIRNSHEPLMPFLKHKKCRNIVGIVKNRVLALNASAVERYISRNVGTPNYLCGVMMSGHMDMIRLSMVLPDILKVCSKKGYGLEINIHPAMMLDTEVTEEIPYDSAMNFYTSPDRHTEALTVRSFAGIFPTGDT